MYPVNNDLIRLCYQNRINFKGDMLQKKNSATVAKTPSKTELNFSKNKQTEEKTKTGKIAKITASVVTAGVALITLGVLGNKGKLGKSVKKLLGGTEKEFEHVKDVTDSTHSTSTSKKVKPEKVSPELKPTTKAEISTSETTTAPKIETSKVSTEPKREFNTAEEVAEIPSDLQVFAKKIGYTPKVIGSKIELSKEILEYAHDIKIPPKGEAKLKSYGVKDVLYYEVGNIKVLLNKQTNKVIRLVQNSPNNLMIYYNNEGKLNFMSFYHDKWYYDFKTDNQGHYFMNKRWCSEIYEFYSPEGILTSVKYNQSKVM